jgi:chromosomal replication initiator protein
MNSDWAKVKEVLLKRIDSRDFSTWIEPLIVDNQTSAELSLKAPNKFIQNWFNEHYANFVQDILYELTSRNIRLSVCVAEEAKQGQLDFGQKILRQEPRPEQIAKKKVARSHFVSMNHGLNPRYNFSRFIEGAGNQLAFAAAKSVAKMPGRGYNPLFIYGATGLGKTHLLHGIGHYLFSDEKPIRVAVMSSERFTNEMIHAIHHGQINSFRKKLREVETLLIDDIQFLSGKERTQEEFFHTFNELYEHGAQIVVTSDRPPRDIDKLEDRLRSRFGWGLIADIQPPDLETRIAILQEKAKDSGVGLPEDAGYFLAEHFQSSIRELEGAFIRVSAFASLNRAPISVDLARQVLKELIGDKSLPITIEQIQKTVSEFFGIKLADLVGGRKQRNFALPRQIAGFLSRELTDASFPEIGEAFGGRDHTTIMHACRKIQQMRAKDPKMAQSLKEIERRIHAV